MAKPRGLEIKVGALVVAALGLLGGFLVILGNVSFAHGWRFFVDFDFSGNIQAGAPVKVAGIKVGKIEAVDFWGGRMDDAVGRRVQVRLRVWVEDRVKESIRQNAEFFVNTAGVLGEQYLEIHPGSWEKPPLAPGAVMRGVDPPRIDLIVARAYEFLDDITSLLRDDRDVIRDFLKNGSHVVRTLDEILSQNRTEIGSLIGNLDRFTAETTKLVVDVRAGIGDPAHLRATLTNVEHLSATISREIEPLLARAQKALDGVVNLTDTVREGDKDKIRKTIDSLVRLSGRVEQVTTDAQHIVAEVRRGKGTAGALLVDEQIYEDVKEMVRDLKRNPWKFLWRE
jgi:phospholipid/cholesterol/gamma-HCH transport system substrate-binding protein